MTTPVVDVKSTLPPDTGLRIGTAHVDAVSGAVTVDVSGKVVNCTYVDPRGLLDGMPVALVRGDASWVCLGTVLTQPMAQEVGTELVSFTAQTSFTQAATFNRAFPVVPVVTTNITSGTGATQSWFSRAFNVTLLGFTLWVHGPSSTWSNVSVGWIAST